MSVLVPSPFTVPRGLAINEDTHDVYLAGSLVGAVMHRFDAGASDVDNTFGAAGNYLGAAVDPTDGDLYALTGGNKIETYSPLGSRFDESDSLIAADIPVGSGDGQIATDAAGHIYVPSSTANTVSEYSRAGALLQTIDCVVPACPATASFNAPRAVAIDGEGSLYVADSGNNRVIKFEASPGSPTVFGSPSVFRTGGSTAVAVDRSNGYVFVGGEDGLGFHVTGYDPAGAPVADFGQGQFGNLFVKGDQLAVDSSTHYVYVSDLSSTSAGLAPRIFVFGPLLAPVVSTGSVSAVSSRAASLDATVNPSGDTVQDCHFDYGLTNSYGQEISCSTDVGFGSIAAPVTARLEGLQANTTYHYRIVATNGAGTVEGNDGEFTTLINPPTATSGPVSAVSQTTATVSGAVNPGGNPVTFCSLEYGTTSLYTTQVPCPADPGSASSEVGESLALSGLTPNTTYHYRISTANAGGPTQGADLTFTTLPKAPAVVTGAATAISPVTVTLTGTLDPQGAASSYHFEYGAGVAYGQNAPAANASGASSLGISAVLSSLKPSTTYHYRLVASNAGGPAQGADRTFTTADRPKGVPTLPATAPISRGKASVALECKGDTLSECQGTLTLRARLKQGIRFLLVPIGSADFDIVGAQTKTVSVTLNGNGKKALAQAKGGKVAAVASAAGKNRELKLLLGSAAGQKHGHGK